MSQNTAIQWANDTLNPFVGCQRTSPACDHCYAADFARRFWPKAAAWDGTIERQSAAAIEKAMSTLEHAHTQRRIFCGSITDFGLVATKDPDGLAHFLSQIYRVQEARIRAGRPTHAFMWLTKRPGALGRFFAGLAFDAETSTFRHAPRTLPLGWERPSKTFPGLWVGVTAEDQPRAEQRIPALLEMELPELLFVSAEPLLGPLRLSRIKLADGGTQNALHGTRTFKDKMPGATRRLRWVVAGGETGHRARPTNPEWAKTLRDEVLNASPETAFFFKSWGAWGPLNAGDHWAGDKVAWMGGNEPIAIEQPVNGYPMAAKRGAKVNDQDIYAMGQDFPFFIKHSADNFLP